MEKEIDGLKNDIVFLLEFIKNMEMWKNLPIEIRDKYRGLVEK